MPLCVYTGVIFLRSSTTPCPISEAAAFTVFLNASGRCISPSVQASPKILFPLLLIHRSNLCIQPLCGFLFVALKGSTMRRVAFSHRWVIFAVCFYMDPGCVAYPCVHIMTTGEKKNIFTLTQRTYPVSLVQCVDAKLRLLFHVAWFEICF